MAAVRPTGSLQPEVNWLPGRSRVQGDLEEDPAVAIGASGKAMIDEPYESAQTIALSFGSSDPFSPRFPGERQTRARSSEQAPRLHARKRERDPKELGGCRHELHFRAETAREGIRSVARRSVGAVARLVPGRGRERVPEVAHES